MVVQPEGMAVGAWTWPSLIWVAAAAGQGMVMVVEMEMVVALRAGA